MSPASLYRDCPEECREAVSSLMFAAARFADLPELRDLRDMFTERYGKALESFVNKEFVENLASKPPTMEKKLQLIRGIAQEFSIKWDSTAFAQKIANSPLPAQERAVNDPKIHGIIPNRDNQDVTSRGRRGLSDGEYILQANREETALGGDNLNVPSTRRRGLSDDGYKPHTAREQASSKENQDVLSRRKGEPTDNNYSLHEGRKENNLEMNNEYTDDGFKTRKDRYKQHKAREESVRERSNECTDDGLKTRKGRDLTTTKKENHDVLSRQEYTDHGLKTHKSRDDTILKRDNLDNSNHERRKHDHGYELQTGREDTVRRKDNQDISSCRDQDYPTIKQKMKMEHKEDSPFAGDNFKAPHTRSSFTEKSTNGVESMKPLPPPPYLKSNGAEMKPLPPPPYLKPNGVKYTASLATYDQATSDYNKAPVEFDDISERNIIRLDRIDNDERRVVEPARGSGHENVEQDDLVGEKKSKPKSVRRRHLKPPPGQDRKGNIEDDEIVKRHPNGRRREDMRQGLQHALNDDPTSKDEEERMMDKLLLHYSKKPSKFEPIQVREGLSALPGHHDVAEVGEPRRHRRKDVARLDSEPVPPPSRAISLPPEPLTPTEKDKTPARATSFQPEMLNQGAHVHPRLPDYDDLAARFAALRGR
ncbi:Regulator of vps4 activity in the mvb pathway protein [Thalictrum thalictroides]|uniref:Regulator of vps4 activity in the mvb pathway protein n=1 Tax=Thalictrum thalictroides TaxID=46969 RepID=A0A7J6VWS9_THATH|nr:Regulator of vps4 activity in the mvb pathway protein [Thalictrum thalictroides]